MGVFLLGVIVIPLAEGALFALLLRELYVRHPLPLGGAIVPMWWNPPKPVANATESSKAQEGVASGEANATDGSPEALNSQSDPSGDAPVDDPTDAQDSPLSSKVSVFDGTENIPEGLSVNNVLNAMTTEAPAANLDSFERIIDESSQADAEIPAAINALADEMNQDDLQALVEALPGTKIDLAQEIEIDSEDSQGGMSMAKEVLGENFDFDALEKQSQQTKESFKFIAPADSINGKESEETELTLDVREDESGMVQVSIPFVANTVPQLTDFAVPQTVVSFFSNDWIQESSGMAESSENDAAKFCFSEESRPMFVRKTRKQG